MNGTWKEKREAEKGIKEYIQASSMGLNKKEKQDFKILVLQNEETARKVFRDSNHVGKGYILIFLTAVYAGPGKTKVKKEFYRSFICTWLEQDKDRYLEAIEKISKDMQKKIFAVLKRENLYTA